MNFNFARYKYILRVLRQNLLFRFKIFLRNIFRNK